MALIWEVFCPYALWDWRNEGDIKPLWFKPRTRGAVFLHTILWLSNYFAVIQNYWLQLHQMCGMNVTINMFIHLFLCGNKEMMFLFHFFLLNLCSVINTLKMFQSLKWTITGSGLIFTRRVLMVGDTEYIFKFYASPTQPSQNFVYNHECWWF